MNSNTRKKPGNPGNSCALPEECASGKCEYSKCQDAQYEKPSATAAEKLNAIRSIKRIEPQNTGTNHPTKIYIPIGHGGENIREKHIVPKGCILVVKSHSGDVTLDHDFVNNVKAILNIENKETVFDPVSHKKELFSLLNSNYQVTRTNSSASSSIAIYREGDTYNNFKYFPVNNLPGSFTSGGLFSLQHDTTVTNLKGIDKPFQVNDNASVFDKDTSGNYTYTSEVIKLNIPSFFSNSDTYKDYYTPTHIQDILDFILLYLNLLQKDQYLEGLGLEKEIVDIIGEKYSKIKKGYTYGVNDFKDSPIQILSDYRVDGNITLKTLFSIITFMAVTTQADLFKDVDAGIIQPGIFYNLICRATEHTFLPENKKTKNSGLLNRKYIGNSDHTILVRNQADEIKNRISEATLQRKNQAKQVFNNKTKKISNNSKVNYVDGSAVKAYIEYMEIMKDNPEDGDIYNRIINLERKKKDIKLSALKQIVFEINSAKRALENPKVLKKPDQVDYINRKLIRLNEVLSKFYTRKAIFTEIGRLKSLIYTLNDPEEKKLYEDKRAFNLKFMKNHQNLGWESFKNDSFLKYNTLESGAPKILTNNYKKYRNETAKNYKKTNNGKWIETPSVGGKRTTRKRN